MKKRYIQKVLQNKNSGLLLAAILLFAIISLASKDFLNPYNIFTNSRTISLLVFVGLTQAMVLVIGHINLSVGAIGGLSLITAGYLISNLGLNIWIGIFLAIIVGITCGAINGIIMAKIGLNSFIATLTTMFIYTGINYGLTQGYNFENIPKSFTTMGRGEIFGVSFIFIFMIIVLIIIFLFYNNTLTGRRSLAIGQNIEAAKYSGINISNLIIFNHSLSGFIAAIGALLYASKMGVISPITGQEWLINSFIIAIVGGTALAGGYISPFGIFLGGIIIVILQNGLTLLKVESTWQLAFFGLLILVALGIDRLRAFYDQRRLLQ